MISTSYFYDSKNKHVCMKLVRVKQLWSCLCRSQCVCATYFGIKLHLHSYSGNLLSQTQAQRAFFPLFYDFSWQNTITDSKMRKTLLCLSYLFQQEQNYGCYILNRAKWLDQQVNPNPSTYNVCHRYLMRFSPSTVNVFLLSSEYCTCCLKATLRMLYTSPTVWDLIFDLRQKSYF